jgi:5-carboxymethyl-2-hydroxymuconate isomerase
MHHGLTDALLYLTKQLPTEVAVPHIQIDYSPNLEARLDMAGLCRILRDAAIATGILPLAGIRVRATACTHVVIADGNPDHAFLDISLRLRGGRSDQDKADATARIFAAAEAYCAEVLATSSFMLSFEMRDIDPDLSPKTSSIRRYLPGETP